MLEKQHKKTIALAMIVKNEEVLLERAIKSCEWIPYKFILDTGSVDRTVEIARRHTDHVDLSYIWTDSFCDAQNFLLEKIRAFEKESGIKIDMILSLDADEQVLSSQAEIESAISRAENVVRVTMVAEGGEKNEFGFGRIFRNTPDIFWCQSIHKHLNVPGEGEDVGEIKIMYGFSPAHLNDPDRSLRMLEHAVATEENPVRNLYYLGREYWYKQRYQDCIDTLQRYVKVSEWPAEKAEAYMNMGQAYKALGDHQQAAENYTKAMIINTNFKEVILEMAAISTHENAVQWRRLAKTANNRDVLWKRIEAEPAPDLILLSTHNDDEALFASFTLIRHRPLVVVVTDSYIQPERGDEGCTAEIRRQETIEAMKIAGCPVVFLGIKDTELTEEVLRERLKVFKPEMIYAPAIQGGNIHHDIVGKVALELFGDKCERYTTYTKTELYTTGNFEIKPTHNELELKEKMLNCYESQLNLKSTLPHFLAVKGRSEWLM
jgi:tetratricopeptide (TPR) repeat protein